MARLFHTGFELNSLTAGVELDTIIGSAGSISSSVKRSGGYSFRSNPDGVNQGWIRKRFASSGITKAWYRDYFRIETLPTGGNSTLILFGQDVSQSGIFYVYLNESGELIIMDENEEVIGTSSILNTGQFYRLEIFVDLTSEGAVVITARLDGSTFADGLADYTGYGFTGNCFVGVGSVNAAVSDVYHDDIAVNDDSGSFENSWCGEGEVTPLRVSADGGTIEWNNNTGTGYQELDEITPDDGTSFIEENTDGLISEFELEDTPSAIGATDIINAVSAGIRFRSNGGASADVVLGIKASSGGDVEESDTIVTDGSSTWYTNAVSEPRISPLTLYNLPGASTDPWTKATLDTVLLRVRCVGASDGIQVSSIYLMVDHKPAAVIPQTENANFFGAGL